MHEGFSLDWQIQEFARAQAEHEQEARERYEHHLKQGNTTMATMWGARADAYKDSLIALGVWTDGKFGVAKEAA